MEKLLPCAVIVIVALAVAASVVLGGLMFIAEVAASLGQDGLSLLAVIGLVVALIVGTVGLTRAITDMRYERQLQALEIERQLRQKNLVRPDRHGLLPIDIDTLRYEPAIVRVLDTYQEHQVSRALPNSRVPTTMTYSPHWSNRNDTNVQGSEIEQQLPAIAQPQSFYELYSSNQLPHDKFLMGYGLEDGEKVLADWGRLYSALVGGQSGSGKSTLIRSVLAQAALQGGRFLVLDPHYGAGDESLGASLYPLRPLMLTDVASTEQQMGDALSYVYDIGQRRLNGQDKDHTPIVLVVDETTALLQRSSIAESLTDTLSSISQETRKVGVYAFCIGQNFHGKIMDTTVRDCFVSYISCRAKKNIAHTMTKDNEFAEIAYQLKIGQAVWMTPQGDTHAIAVPNCTSRDLEMIGQQLPSTTGKDSFRSPSRLLPKPFQMDVAEGDRKGFGRALEGVADATAQRILSLFQAGNSSYQIVQDVFGVSGGRRYQEGREQVENVIRGALRGENV